MRLNFKSLILLSCLYFFLCDFSSNAADTIEDLAYMQKCTHIFTRRWEEPKTIEECIKTFRPTPFGEIKEYEKDLLETLADNYLRIINTHPETTEDVYQKEESLIELTSLLRKANNPPLFYNEGKFEEAFLAYRSTWHRAPRDMDDVKRAFIACEKSRAQITFLDNLRSRISGKYRRGNCIHEKRAKEECNELLYAQITQWNETLKGCTTHLENLIGEERRAKPDQLI